jgi:LmbE family N-acetylglucosaminyl deacetylase
LSFSLRGIPWWKRLVSILVLSPLLLAGGASGAYYLRLHQVARGLQVADLPVGDAVPAAPGRMLVLAPHCDDETLALGGTIADARRRGVEVTVAFLTNGDGFPLAAHRALGEVRVSRGDYVRFAERRQQESLDALAELGVGPRHVLFLSYPDRGLEALWGEHWDAERPFRSLYTGCDRSPYPRTFTPGAAYSGSSLLADLRTVLRRTKPSEIFVTHPADDHDDHAAAAAFAQAALLAARDGGEEWARSARLRYYLVHRGDWPLPQGMRPDAPLVPPAPLLALDTRWEVLPLTAEARAAKARALGRYRSQVAVMRRFLGSFVRRNELAATLPDHHLGPSAAAGLTVPDATRDDVVRYAGPSADLSALTVTRDANADAVRVGVVTRGPISPRVRYRLEMRAAGDRARGGTTRFLALDLSPRTRQSGMGSALRIRDNRLDVVVPLARLGLSAGGPGRVWVAARTSWARVPVDQTGFRLVTFGGVNRAAEGAERRARTGDGFSDTTVGRERGGKAGASGAEGRPGAPRPVVRRSAAGAARGGA